MEWKNRNLYQKSLTDYHSKMIRRDKLEKRPLGFTFF